MKKHLCMKALELIFHFMLTLEKKYGRWFYGPYHGHVTSTGYFHCYERSCPFSFKVGMREEGGVLAPYVENVVFGWHCHEHPENSKKANREMIEEERKIIERGDDVEDEIANKHEAWKQKAKSESKKLYDELSERDDTVDYACKRPHLSGRQVEQNTGEKNDQVRDRHGPLASNEKRGTDRVFV